MKLLLEILKGGVVGLANVIPGVSGGTMMVSMGIYDKIIGGINGLLKHFVDSIKMLWPYLVGMVLAIVVGSFTLKYAFAQWPLPTNTLFVGLILGGVPMILKEMKGTRPGVPGVLLFVLFAALIILQKATEGEATLSIELSVVEVIKLFAMGAVCSATMVIPGVSGSMILKSLGYYNVVVTEAIPGLVTGLTGGGMDMVLHNVGILLPFGIGVVVGIFAIAKLIAVLMAKWKGATYCAILGMVLASNVAIMMDKANYASVNAWLIAASVVTFALGFFIALKLGGDPEQKEL